MPTFDTIYAIKLEQQSYSYIDITSIPNTYKNLKLVVRRPADSRTSATGTVTMRFNNSQTRYYQFGLTARSYGDSLPFRYANETKIYGHSNQFFPTTGSYSWIEMEVLNYTSSGKKSFIVKSGHQSDSHNDNSPGAAEMSSGEYSISQYGGSSAISSIQVEDAAYGLPAGTFISLYGMS